MRFLEQSNSRRQKVEWWLPEAGRGEDAGRKFQSGKIINVLDISDSDDDYNNMNVLNSTKLYT